MNSTEKLEMTVNRGQNGAPIFEAGKTYTIFRINDFTMTTKQVIQVTRFDDDGNPIYKIGKKRSEFILKLKFKRYVYDSEHMFNGMVFEGETPFSCDTDQNSKWRTNTMRGNALFNFVGDDIESVKKYIEQNQRNPWAEIERAVFIKDGQETLIFPEFYKGGHAVIDRILSR